MRFAIWFMIAHTLRTRFFGLTDVEALDHNLGMHHCTSVVALLSKDRRTGSER